MGLVCSPNFYLLFWGNCMRLQLQNVKVVEHFRGGLGAVVHFLVDWTVFLWRLDDHRAVALLVEVVVVAGGVLVGFSIVVNIVGNVVDVSDFGGNSLFLWIEHAFVDETHEKYYKGRNWIINLVVISHQFCYSYSQNLSIDCLKWLFITKKNYVRQTISKR